VLLLGADGMLGRAWVDLLVEAGIEHRATDVATLDITDAAAVTEAISEGVDAVVNCAAFADVDGAESRESEAAQVNERGPAVLAARCRETGSLLVHYSTDYVFDGRASEPYEVAHPLQPMNAYGRTKAAGERRIRESGCKHLVVRTSWLYAPWGKNFVRTIARLARERDRLDVVDDQRGRPTSVEHLAGATMALMMRTAAGTFHVTDGGECTWYDFARAIATKVAPTCQVQPCSSDAFPRPAPRPAYSVLDLSQTEALLGPMPTWHENLDRVLERIDLDHAEIKQRD
jgi:dTDP-4-dehydrorhamnose reductase